MCSTVRVKSRCSSLIVVAEIGVVDAVDADGEGGGGGNYRQQTSDLQQTGGGPGDGHRKSGGGGGDADGDHFRSSTTAAAAQLTLLQWPPNGDTAGVVAAGDSHRSSDHDVEYCTVSPGDKGDSQRWWWW